MIDKAERLQNRLGPEIQEFRDARNTLQLGTVDKDGKHIPVMHRSRFQSRATTS